MIATTTGAIYPCTDIEMIRDAFGSRTFLDVGASTGRGIRSCGSWKGVRDIKPLAAMIEKAESNGFLNDYSPRAADTSCRLTMVDLTRSSNAASSTTWSLPSLGEEMIRVASGPFSSLIPTVFGQDGKNARFLKRAL
jgi:hypothetical protein